MGKLGTDGAIRKAREMVKEDPEKYFMPDQFSNEFNKIAHYRTTGEEIWKQTKGEIDYFVLPSAHQARLWVSAKY